MWNIEITKEVRTFLVRALAGTVWKLCS